MDNTQLRTTADLCPERSEHDSQYDRIPDLRVPLGCALLAQAAAPAAGGAG